MEEDASRPTGVREPMCTNSERKYLRRARLLLFFSFFLSFITVCMYLMCMYVCSVCSCYCFCCSFFLLLLLLLFAIVTTSSVHKQEFTASQRDAVKKSLLERQANSRKKKEKQAIEIEAEAKDVDDAETMGSGDAEGGSDDEEDDAPLRPDMIRNAVAFLTNPKVYLITTPPIIFTVRVIMDLIEKLDY